MSGNDQSIEWMKTSEQLVLPFTTGQELFVSLGTRFEAGEAKATVRPSPEIDAKSVSLLALPPPVGTLTRVVTPVRRSCTNTSLHMPGVSPGRHTFVSSATRGTLAPTSTKRPSSEIRKGPLVPPK